MSRVHRELTPIVRWLRSDDLLTPPGLEDKARLLLLDTVGCILAGLSAAPVAQFAREHQLLGGGAALHPIARAQVFAMAATWDEACEGLARAHGRPGVAVIACLLALADRPSVTLGSLLADMVAGYEIGARMGEWLRNKPGMHVDAGWPALGVAAAIARHFGGSADDMLAAIETTSCQLALGLYAPVAAGATARNTYLAHAATLGMLAAVATRAGIDAPTNGLAEQARIGYGLDESQVVLAPPGEWLIQECYLKPFAAVRHVHYGVQAALALRPALYARLHEIDAIDLQVYPEALTYCGNRAPATPIAAQFSLSFGVAAALRFGDLSPAVYRPGQFHEAGLRQLEALVTLTADESLAHVSTQNAGRAARLRVRCGDQTFEQLVTSVKGDVHDPFSSLDCERKFADYAAAALVDTASVNALAAAILRGRLDASAADVLQPISTALHGQLSRA